MGRDFPDGPGAKTLHSQHRGPGFNPRVRELYPTFCNYRPDYPGGPVVKNLPVHAGDTSSIPGLGRLHITEMF